MPLQGLAQPEKPPPGVKMLIHQAEPEKTQPPAGLQSRFSGKIAQAGTAEEGRIGHDGRPGAGAAQGGPVAMKTTQGC
jgi:hypothetical protein